MTNQSGVASAPATGPAQGLDYRGKVVLVTGGTKGIGAGIAQGFLAAGAKVVVCGRSAPEALPTVDGIAAEFVAADVRDIESLQALFAAIRERHGRLDVLVNNAGGAKGLAPVSEANLEDWRWMWETNVVGTLRITKALLPKLEESGDGLIITITSTAALEAYDNGAGYTSAKHAQGVLHRTLRMELIGKPIRLTEICPGMVETEFSLVRFDGDAERADSVYQGLQPMVADDIAEIISFTASRPSHVNLDQIVVRPRDQASARRNIKTG